MIFSQSHLLCTIKSQKGGGEQWGAHGVNGGRAWPLKVPIVTPLHNYKCLY